MSGLTAMPAHRRFVSDLRDPRCIPAVDAPEIAALEAERRRLVAALEEAERSGGGYVDEARYIGQRARALGAGEPLPPSPPTAAEAQAAAEQRRRNVAAAEEALLRFADVVCRTVEAHPEWREAARAKVKAAQDEAEAAMAQAKAAARRAEDAAWLVQHLERTASDELYIARVSDSAEAMPKDEPDLVWNITDPRILGLMERSRTGAPL
jgi:hypothetical protein